MNSLITPLEQIKTELEQIQSDLEITTGEQPEEVLQYANILAVHLSRSGKLLADAKYHKDKKLNSDVVQNLKTILSLSASSANKYLDTICFEENYLVNWGDRVNRACTHRLDLLRSILSYEKEQQKNLNYGT